MLFRAAGNSGGRGYNTKSATQVPHPERTDAMMIRQIDAIIILIRAFQEYPFT